MPTEVILPRVDMDMDSGKISRWFVENEATVTKGQPLFEIETAKAAMEIEAPVDGVLRDRVTTLNIDIPIGSVVANIYARDESYAPPAHATSDATPPRSQAIGPPQSPSRQAPPAAISRDNAQGLRATPLARQLAKRAGLSLTDIEGAGPRGRIQSADVEAAIAGRARVAPSREHDLHHVWLREGRGRPIVMLHGLFSDIDFWRPLLSSLTIERPILAIDLPSHGRSVDGGEASLDEIADAIERTLARANVGESDVIGHSLGGAAAAVVAARASAGVRSVTLISPAGLSAAINGDFIDGVLRARSEASLAPWLRLLVADEKRLAQGLAKAMLARRADGAAKEEALAQRLFPDGTQAISIASQLAALVMPAKIIFGRDDRIVPPTAAYDAPGRVALHFLSHVGHAPPWEARADVAALIEQNIRAA